MIQIKSKVKILDNSGARIANVINVLKKAPTCPAKIGDILVVSARRIILTTNVQKGKKYHAVVVRLKKHTFRYGGIYIAFENSAVVLLNAKNSLIATRILGVVSQDLKYSGFIKIMALAPNII